MPEMKFESVILHVCLISVRLNPSHVHLKCAHTDPRSGPRSRKSDEVFAADVAGEQRGADLFERQREILRILLTPVSTFKQVGRKSLTGSQNMCLPARKKPLTVSLFFLNID